MENTLAEKLVSKFEDGSASIRHKDFFDLWLLIATLRRIGDFSVLDASASDEEDLRSEVRGRLSDGSLLEMPCREISDACKGRLSLAMARTSAHRGTTIPDDVAAFLEDEFANDLVQPRQWANWLRNNGARLKYRPPGQGSKDSLAALVADVGPFLEEIAAIARDHAAEPTARIAAF
jgi:hypothetical protein